MRVRFRKQSFGVAAKTAGEKDFRGVALMVELSGPAGDVCIEIAEADNAVGFFRLPVQIEVVPNHLQRSHKFIHIF